MMKASLSTIVNGQDERRKTRKRYVGITMGTWGEFEQSFGVILVADQFEFPILSPSKPPGTLTQHIVVSS